MVSIVDAAFAFMESYGLIAIFILLVLDGAMLLPVFPGEIALILAVTTFANTPGDLVFLILLTSLASLLGSLLLYGIMRGGGRRVVERFPRLFMMPPRRRERMENTFQKPLGQTLVLFLRVFPLTRVIVNIPAGLAKMPVVRFIILSAIGLVVFHAGFLWFTYEAGRPESVIGGQTAQLQAAYASPAWEWVQANAIAVGAVLLVIGILASIRSSRKMARDHDAGGSMLGALAWIMLFWGGVALAAITYSEPRSAVRLAELGGVRVTAAAEALGIRETTLLFLASAVMLLLALILSGARHEARLRRHRKAQQDTRDLQDVKASLPAWHGRPATLQHGFEVVPNEEKEREKRRPREEK